MEIRLKPQMKSMKVERECPSGKMVLNATVGYFTPNGFLIAEKTVGSTYGANKIEWREETLAAAKVLLSKLLLDIEEELRDTLERNLEEEATVVE